MWRPRRHCSCRQAALATCPCCPRLTRPRSPLLRRQLRCGAAATVRRRAPRARPTVAGARHHGREVAARACGRRGRRRTQWSGWRLWRTRSGGRSSRSGVGAASPPLRSRLCHAWTTGARLQPRGAAAGSEAVLGGPSLARRWSRNMLGPAGSPAAHIRSCCGNVHVCIWVYSKCENYRDLSRSYLP